MQSVFLFLFRLKVVNKTDRNCKHDFARNFYKINFHELSFFCIKNLHRLIKCTLHCGLTLTPIFFALSFTFQSLSTCTGGIRLTWAKTFLNSATKMVKSAIKSTTFFSFFHQKKRAVNFSLTSFYITPQLISKISIKFPRKLGQKIV